MWKCAPDWRFGQLVYNAIVRCDKDLFSIEDNAAISLIEALFNRQDV